MIKGIWNIFSFLTFFLCLVLAKREWSYRIRVIVLAKKKCFLGAISGGGRLSKTWFWTLRTTQLMAVEEDSTSCDVSEFIPSVFWEENF